MATSISHTQLTNDKVCPNCTNNSWVQQDVILLRCSGCKFISYCSKECQREHWEKVHKQHCKYMAEKDVKPMSKHNSVTCPDCQAVEKSGGLEELMKKDNPVLPCPWAQITPPALVNPSTGDLKLPIPFALAEMSGKFLTRAEHSASLMLRLICKMGLIQHTAWTTSPEDSKRISHLVLYSRIITWEAYVDGTTGSDSYTDSDCVTELSELIDIIDGKLAVVNYVDEGVFRPWETFKVLFNMILVYRTDAGRIAAESFGMPKIHKALQTKRMTSDQFSSIWQKLLDMMSGKLVPYTNLREILCGGELKKVCDGCFKEITIVEVFFYSHEQYNVPFFIFGPCQFFFCGDDCSNKIPWRKFNIWFLITYLKIFKKSESYKCDNCGLPKSKVHRCTKCLTKVYCGLECRDEDWEKVHRVVCREGEEKRKRKGGEQARKEDGEKNIEDLLEYISGSGMDDASLKCFENYFQSVFNLKSGD